MPLPQFFIREMVLPREKRTVREVVDGQQRLTTVLEFLEGRFGILPMHNSEFARLKFDELPEVAQRDFLSFPLSVNILEGTEDADVLEIFSRLNSYSVPLNAQEKLNAQYVGSFKKAMLDLARDHLAFWKRHKILTAQPIARMRDVELTCELIAVMLSGLQNQKKIIATMYRRFDSEFNEQEAIRNLFGDMLQRCEDILGGDIGATAFRRLTLFYSLFAVVYDLEYGFGNVGRPIRRLDPDGVLVARQNLIALSEAIESEETIQENWRPFYQASQQSTDKLKEREARHVLLRELILPAFLAA